MGDHRRSIISFGDEEEKIRRSNFVDLLGKSPIPKNEYLQNCAISLTPQTLSRIIFMDFLYRQIIDVQGNVMEFGCRWGQNLCLFTNLRGIYEPFNRLRKVIGFDTFEGFPSVSMVDGSRVQQGDYSTSVGYENYLNQLLGLHEQESPMSHLKKYEIIKGDVCETVPQYFDKHPEAIISLAYFDLDIYKPTKYCLEHIKNYITKGTVIGFDEINDETTPGETVALREVLGLSRYAIKRFPYNSRTSYIVVE